MAWLLRNGEVLASLERRGETMVSARGGLGPDRGVAQLFSPARMTHTLGTRYPVDVAYLDANLVVIDTCRMKPLRVGVPRSRAHAVLKIEAGAFERWGLRRGDHLEIRD